MTLNEFAFYMKLVGDKYNGVINISYPETGEEILNAVFVAIGEAYEDIKAMEKQ